MAYIKWALLTLAGRNRRDADNYSYTGRVRLAKIRKG